MYNRGRGVTIDYDQAVSWYRRAAEGGYAWAQYFLGLKLSLGQGVAQNEKEAANWYRRAAEQEHALAQYNLANMYLKGTAIPKSLESAYQWALIANAYAHPDAESLSQEIELHITPQQQDTITKSVKTWIRKHR